MIPQLAALLIFTYIIALFWLDLRKKSDCVSRAIWIPFIWIFFAGSRFASQWLTLGVIVDVSSFDYLEGNPLDRNVLFALIMVALYILHKRNINWRVLFRNNIWIFLYFLFGAVSMIWSDYPFVSLKRLIKASGNVIMALVILTEERPDKAVIAVLRRFAYLFVPLSLLFIKYYPDFGRIYNLGSPMYTGAALGKNSLGQSTLISIIGFGWFLFIQKPEAGDSEKRLRLLLYIPLILMLIWLIYMADSATSLICIIVTLGIFLFSSLLGIARGLHRILTISIVMVVVLLVLEALFNISSLLIVDILGRDLTLTTRVPMWESLFRLTRNPFLGAGYESFWLGDRMTSLYGTWGVFNAHNGYLETYLNMGIIGLSLIVISMAHGLFFKVRAQLKEGSPLAVLKLVFVITAFIYNWAEASLHGTNNIWLLMLFGLLDTSGQPQKLNDVSQQISEIQVKPHTHETV